MTKRRKHFRESASLKDRIGRCIPRLITFSGTICRAVGTKYANSSDLLTGEGAKKFGGRWNPPGLFGAVYGSLDPYAALAETVGSYGHYSIPFEQRLPLVLVAIRCELRLVLDLADGKVRSQLGVSLQRFLDCDWQEAQDKNSEGITQAIGRLAWESKIEAIFVPSARLKNEKNLVIFPGLVKKPSFMKIINRKQLIEPR